MKRFFPLIVIVLLSYFAFMPFLISGFFPMHDDTQVARVFEMKKALGDGMFPVRWVSDLGYHYGYPIFNFYAPLAFYVGGFINLIGFDALIATKIMMVLGIVLAGIFMYFLAKEFWGVGGGMVSALLYVYAPYHALDIYVRGDAAEFWAYAFIPLVFYGLWQSYRKKNWKYVVIGSLGFAGVILSHNLTAMMITPFLVLFAGFLCFSLWKGKKSSQLYYPFVIILLGILLASFYWLPVFAEMKYTNVLSQVGGGADYKDHFVCPMQLWSSPWGFGGSTATCIDGLSFKIGKFHLLLFVISLGSLFFLRKEDKMKFWWSIVTVVSVILGVFLMLNQSKFIWDVISQMAFFQYPWRFLLIVSFFVSFFGGATIWLGRRFIPSYGLFGCFIGLVMLALIYLNIEIFVPQTILKKTAGDYTNIYELTWVTSKISDEYMPKGFVKPKNSNEVPQNKITFSSQNIKMLDFSEKTQRISAKLHAKEKTDVAIHHAYFPAWHVTIDGKEAEFIHSNRGMSIAMPAGIHTLVVQFQETPIEKVANALSLTGVLLIIIGIMTQRKERKHAAKST